MQCVGRACRGVGAFGDLSTVLWPRAMAYDERWFASRIVACG
jgi:hypothetical protein